MKTELKVICMAFDGSCQIERPIFDTVEEAWEYAGNLGSKWFFYPFVFVVSGSKIREAPYMLEFLNGRKLTTVQRIFKEMSEKEEMQGADIDYFISKLIK